MRIKRYRARDIQSALRMVKDELGQDAVILSTREIKDRAELGPAVEITAGIGYAPKLNPPDPKPAQTEQPEPKSAQTEQQDPASWNPFETEPSSSVALKGLEGGLAEIKDLLLDLTHRSNLSDRLRDRQEMVRLYRGLVDSELDPALARALVERVADAQNGHGSDIRRTLEMKLSGALKTKRPLDENRSDPFNTGPAFLALAGPAGVGKTTTMAKLAAYWSGRHRKKVGLISLDTFRLGASEQVRTYARIMGLPVRVAQDKEEFWQAVELFDNMDLVLIDTSGRALSRQDAMDELQTFLGMLSDVGVMLVLSAATKDRDLAAAIQKTETLSVHSLIITKIDETDRYGNVINNLIKYKKPVSFLTNGQKVPDDILPATPTRLAELLTSSLHDTLPASARSAEK